jgi:hypothetical protein
VRSFLKLSDVRKPTMEHSCPFFDFYELKKL